MRPALCLLLWLLFAPTAQAERVTVFAAASLKEALEDVARTFAADTGHDVVPVLAGSSALARQIEQGAPADIFISANPAWMDRLDDRGHLRPGTRSDLLGNRLVLIARGAEGPPLPLGPDLAAKLDGGRLAIALTEAVPAGLYGKAALTTLGLWPALRPHLAEADNTRAALALVALGAAPLGIVYATDAAAEPRVHVAATFPNGSHPPIVYPAAQITDSAAAAAFLTALKSPAAAEIFQAHGFQVLAP